MILEYTYDNAMEVLKAFQESTIATLNIKTVKEDNEKVYFIMEYTTLDSYDKITQSRALKVLQDSLKERLKAVNVLNRFIENEILGNVISFNFDFSVINTRKCRILYSSSFNKTATTSAHSVSDLMQWLEKFDRIVLDMGIHNQEVPGMFKREGTGKSKKYSQLTIGEINSGLRKLLTEE